MSCYVPDLIERAESAAERAYERMSEGMPRGLLLCGCGHAFSEGSGTTISASPWAMPVCEMCFDAWERKYAKR